MITRKGSLDALLHASTGCVYEGIIHAYEIAKRNMDLDRTEKLAEVVHKGMCNLLGFQVWCYITCTLLCDVCTCCICNHDVIWAWHSTSMCYVLHGLPSSMLLLWHNVASEHA